MQMKRANAGVLRSLLSFLMSMWAYTLRLVASYKERSFVGQKTRIETVLRSADTTNQRFPFLD
jgi:hypothetical protein